MQTINISIYIGIRLNARITINAETIRIIDCKKERNVLSAKNIFIVSPQLIYYTIFTICFSRRCHKNVF